MTVKEFRLKLRMLAVIALALSITPESLRAYVLDAERWTRNRTVVMQLSLGPPQALLDGSTSFNQVAQEALNAWNTHLAHLRFGSVVDSPVPPGSNDNEMSVFFSSTVFGESFGNNVLAVTLVSSRGNVTEETDTIFNTRWNWNAYRGALRSGIQDFRRVAIHEFGHTLGLNHPDEHGERVAAIMNSTTSDIDYLTGDDIAGAQALYGSGPPYLNGGSGPVLMNISTRAYIATAQNVLIGGFIIQGSQAATVILRGIGFSLREAGILNAMPDPMITVYNANNQLVATNDDWFTSGSAETIASYGLDPHNSIESALILTLQPGAYTVVVSPYSDAQQPAMPGVGLFELYDLHLTNARAANISSRGQVQTGDRVLIGGFVVGPGANKQVIARAIGPSLANVGIANALPDPTLSLYDGSGNLLQMNNDWEQGPNAATIAGRGLAPSNPRESALMATLAPGNYTAIVSGVNGATGVGLVEVYDQSPPP